MHKRTVTLLGSVVIATLVSFTTATVISGGLQPRAIAAPESRSTVIPADELTSVNMQSYLDPTKPAWLYSASAGGQGQSPYVVSAHAGKATAQDLNEYAAINKAQGETLTAAGVASLYVWVTFRHPLAPAEFEVFVKDYSLDVRHYTLRAYGEKGDRITINGGPVDGKLFPDIYDHAMQSIQQRENGQARLSGVFDVKGQVAASNYSKLTADPRVFIADVTASLAFREMNARGMLNNLTWDEYVSQVQVGATLGPFWQMEDIGLDKFK